MIEVIVPPNAQMPAPHSHDAFEETFLGLEGQVTLIVEGHEHRLQAGDALCVQRGEIHGFRNDTEETIRFIAVAAPGVFGWPYFKEMADAFAAFGEGPPDKAVLGEIMRRHGLTPASMSAARHSGAGGHRRRDRRAGCARAWRACRAARGPLSEPQLSLLTNTQHARTVLGPRLRVNQGTCVAWFSHPTSRGSRRRPPIRSTRRVSSTRGG